MWKTFQERQGWLEAWVNPHPWCFQQLPENETLWKKNNNNLAHFLDAKQPGWTGAIVWTTE
jgi:hypothetical protein